MLEGRCRSGGLVLDFSFGAGWVEAAAVLSFGMRASAEGAYSGVLAPGLTWPNLQQLLHCLEGDEGYALSMM